jgi:hypothetical protein
MDRHNLWNNLTSQLIDYIEHFIKDNNSYILPSMLTNWQIPISLNNLETIKKQSTPSYIYCGENAGGFYTYHYYRHSKNNTIYIITFYCSEIDSYSILTDDWEKQLRSFNTMLN